MASGTYQNRKASGICIRCGKRTAEPGRVRCAECAEKNRIYEKEIRAWRLSKGYCPRCGKERLWGDEKSCPECAAKTYSQKLEWRQRLGDEARRKEKQSTLKHRKKMKELGLCIVCGKPAAPGRSRCKKCALKNKLYRRRVRLERPGIPRAERVSRGMCYFCGDPLAQGKRTCEACRARLAANAAKRKAPG